MKSSSYYVGLALGIGLVIIIFAVAMIIKKKKNPGQRQYDEMQLASRGKAFQAGFFGLLIANVIGIILSTVLPPMVPPFFVFSSACMIGVAIFAISAIRNDAYFGFNENKKASTRFIALMGVLNLVVGFLNLLGKGLYDGEELNIAVLNILIVILSAVIVIAVAIHNRKVAADMEVDE